tara:strand:- start:1464 stop:2066 length:603 start_codon:yes stop_codon:yes gene_type:complete
MALLFAKNNSLSAVTALPASISGGGFNLISTQTASSSSTISFTSGIDSTYKEYIFKIINCHPATDNVNFQVNFRDGGSSYDATKTTTFFSAYHNEAGGTSNLGYVGGSDLAQGTGVQRLSTAVGNDSDHCISGTLHLFNPSSTTFIKHFIATTNITEQSDFTENSYIAGYCNVTAAIDSVQFSFSSGNIDSGIIKMYGVT